MPKMLELRWHARGGQGAVTASKVLADAALEMGKHVQSFPEYGSERMGAPIKAFNRISDTPITIYSSVTDPDIVIVLDETLLNVVDVSEGLKDDGILLVNTELTPAEVRENIVEGHRFRIFTVDATSISRKYLGRRMPNTPTIGALTGLVDVLSTDDICASFRANYTDVFSKDVLEGNLKAIREAAVSLSKPEAAKGPGGRGPLAKPKYGNESYKELPRAGYIVASELHAYLRAGNAVDYNTGSWRADRPVWDSEKCTHCFRCFIFCPDAAITFDPETEKMTGHDLVHCKGCGLCAEVCPPKVKAITMVNETSK
ncbi:MAG: 2-oxoacid:acceptor oxidoreductase family protein [bacterium]|nr:2-oxoacid:acceptor oxidoreductase family protein [bacterium]